MVGSPRLQDWPPQTAFPKPTLLQKKFLLELFFLLFFGYSVSRTKTFLFILQLMSILNFQKLLKQWVFFVLTWILACICNQRRTPCIWRVCTGGYLHVRPDFRYATSSNCVIEYALRRIKIKVWPLVLLSCHNCRQHTKEDLKSSIFLHDISTLDRPPLRNLPHILKAANFTNFTLWFEALWQKVCQHCHYFNFTKVKPFAQETVPTQELSLPLPDTCPCSTTGGSQDPFEKKCHENHKNQPQALKKKLEKTHTKIAHAFRGNS